MKIFYASVLWSILLSLISVVTVMVVSPTPVDTSANTIMLVGIGTLVQTIPLYLTTVIVNYIATKL